MKVHFSIRGDFDGYNRAGAPVHPDFMSSKLSGKTINVIAYSNDESDFTINLPDQGKIVIFSSSRGAEMVYFPPGYTVHYD